ncbi:MAG: peptide-methionine (S)-S-oxide reductase MsrA [Caulobacteraceae bacterium]|nr:peptide-methionine (S)-S-oxide reductase MsrA [Caulobacteraceae bacterium]
MTPTLPRRLALLSALVLATALVAAVRPAPAAPRLQTAIFAGGCFWCTESDMEHIPGVVSAVSGYTGGTTRNPTYEQVGSERTGHVEAVRVTFDASRISYRQLVDRFWRTIDVTDDGGQFCDRGPNYRTAVFVTPAQRPIAEASRAAAARDVRTGRLLTPIRLATTFWPAEDYHQDFYKKNPLRYRVYRQGCGRDSRLNAVWGR